MDEPKSIERSLIAHRFNLLIAVIIGLAVIFIVGVALYLKRPGEIQTVAFTQQSSFAFVVVFLCYGFVALLLVIFFAYRILSPFGRLLKEMENILSGDVSKRLYLRDQDVYLIRCFVENVNTILDRLQNMHIQRDELSRQIHTEGYDIVALVEKDESVSNETKEALITYHEKVKALIEAHREEPRVVPKAAP
ncbi:MAG: methyl-accepting chemotaxis protein [Nitrospirae bacterium]|nr:methyl-accepting chemotaxis protein [Nitrospirota bacterium]